LDFDVSFGQAILEMNATAIWIALLAVAVLFEVLGRLRPTRVSTLNRFGSMISRRLSVRVILILLWIFVGIHLFARYTIPRS
jgi:hypothetical protein